jgi:hypothetical protein
MPKTCFVIGPIGEPGSKIREDADDLMNYIINPCVTLNEFGYDPPMRADRMNEPGRITSQIIKLLVDADLVIADLTTNNANVYYSCPDRRQSRCAEISIRGATIGLAPGVNIEAAHDRFRKSPSAALQWHGRGSSGASV